MLLYPPVLLAEFLIVDIVHGVRHVGWLAAITIIAKAIEHVLWVERGFVGAFIGVAFTLYLIAYIRAMRLEKQHTVEERQKRLLLEQQREERLRKEREMFIGFLTCGTQPINVELQGIPSQYRTLRLRYKDLKAKVCRPFAR